MSATLRASVKMFGFLVLLIIFMTGAALIFLFERPKYLRKHWLSLWAHRLSQITLKLFNIKVSAVGKINPFENYFFVSNHLGYLDILILAAQSPCLFVTSIEVKNMRFLGTLSKLGGCLYVERRSRENIHNEIQEIIDALALRLNVCVFPEATSTNGNGVLKFKRSLYQAATATHTLVKPICLNYTLINDAPLSVLNRDKVCWYGDMDFLPHLWQVMKCRSIKMNLIYGPNMKTSADDCIVTVAEESYRFVASHFTPANQLAEC
jgi:lyso-ornithine lipid O-acyltransferase